MLFMNGDRDKQNAFYERGLEIYFSLSLDDGIPQIFDLKQLLELREIQLKVE